MIKSFLQDRELVYQAEVTSGANQSSTLGQELCNISYDDIFYTEMPTETYLVGYADDVTTVIAGRT